MDLVHLKRRDFLTQNKSTNGMATVLERFVIVRNRLRLNELRAVIICEHDLNK